MHFERVSEMELLKSYVPVSLPENMKAEIVVTNIISMHISVYTYMHVVYVCALQYNWTLEQDLFLQPPVVGGPDVHAPFGRTGIKTYIGLPQLCSLGEKPCCHLGHLKQSMLSSEAW